MSDISDASDNSCDGINDNHTQISIEFDALCTTSQESNEMIDNNTNDGAWKNWSKEEVAILNEHLKYKLDVLARTQAEIELINKAWRSGPLGLDERLKPISKPVNSLELVLFKSEPKRRQKNERKQISFQTMTDLEFADYLKNKRLHREILDNVGVFENDNLEFVAKQLETKFAQLMCKECDILNDKIDFGLMLLEAKRIFKQKRSTKQATGSWYQWVDKNTEICKSYANRCIFVANFVKQYPKLRSLNMCFTDLFKIIGKMKKVFRNDAIASQWK